MTGERFRSEIRPVQSSYKEELDNFSERLKINVANFGENENKEIRRRFVSDFESRGVDETVVERLNNPEYLNAFFEKRGYKIHKPKSIINEGGSTLFTSAGVQILDDVIFREAVIPQEKIYVAQPVLRSQFIDEIKPGTSTSFVNISTEVVNPGLDEHFRTFSDWLDLLSELGIKEGDLDIFSDEDEPSWGGKKFKNKILRIFYRGLEIGDSVYAHDVPQGSRSPINFSDIGFGLERIKWSKRINYGELAINERIEDYCKTLALLSGSGLQPSNHDQGYRMRLFSKRLLEEKTEVREQTDKALSYYYDYWTRWAHLKVEKGEAVARIAKENGRNFNRILLDKLKEKHADVDININLSTSELINKLKGTSVGAEELQRILQEIYG